MGQGDLVQFDTCPLGCVCVCDQFICTYVRTYMCVLGYVRTLCRVVKMAHQFVCAFLFSTYVSLCQ